MVLPSVHIGNNGEERQPDGNQPRNPTMKMMPIRWTIFAALGLALLAAMPVPTSAQAKAADPPQLTREVVDGIQAAVKLYQEGKIAEALRAFEALLPKAPENADLNAWLGFLYLRTEQPAKAIAPLQKVRELRPKDVESLVNLGNAMLATNRADEALGAYHEAVKLKADLPDAHYNIGNIHLRRKRWDEAAAAYRASLAIREDPFARNNLGNALEGKGSQLESAQQYQRAADAKADNLTFVRNAAFAWFKLRSNERALPMMQKAAALAANDADVAMALADLYTRVNRRVDARKHLEANVERFGANATFWFNLGVLRNEAGDSAGAAQAYRKALEIKPDELDAMNNLGLLMFKQGKFEEAAQLFDRYVGLNPGSLAGKINLASALARSNSIDRAVEFWREIVQANPKRSDVRLDLANELWRRKDQEGARFHFNQVLLNEPNNPGALNGLGLWDYEKADWRAAEQKFRAAIAADPKFVPAYNNLAICLEKLNRLKEAIEMLERALKIDPKYPEALENLKRMRAPR